MGTLPAQCDRRDCACDGPRRGGSGMSIAPGVLPPVADPFAPVTNDHTDERWYPYPPTGELFESVTYLNGATEAKPWLATWYARLSMEWAIDNLALLARTKRTEGRQAAVDLGKDEAKRRRDIKADTGTFLHDVGETLILWATEPADTRHHVPYPELPAHLRNAVYDYGGEQVPVPQMVEWMADGWVQFVSDFGLRPEDFLACEMPVYNPELKIAGTVDTILILRGYNICGRAACHLGAFCPGAGSHVVADPGHNLVLLVDFKTGATGKPTWKEQLAAYLRMTECRPDKTDDRVFPVPKADAAAVLHLRPEHPGGYLLHLVSTSDDEEAWERFLSSVATVRGRRECRDKPGSVVRALRPDGTMPGPRLGDLASEGYGRALAPLREAFGAAAELEDLAGLTAGEVLDVHGVGAKMLDTIRRMLADHGLSLVPGWRLSDMAAEGYPGLAPLIRELGAGTELKDLAGLTAAELRGIKGAGPKVVATVRKMLADHGLSLAGDFPAGKAA